MKKSYWNVKQRATLGVSVKLRNDYADYDYLNKLNPEELKFLKAFHREFVNADFKHKHGRIYDKKYQKQRIYALNNARNRDVFNIKKWTGQLYYIHDDTKYQFKAKWMNQWFQ